MKPSRSKISQVRVVLCAVNLLLPLRVFAAGSDDFNDNSKDATKWGADVQLGLGVLTEQNQHLEFTCNNAASDGDTLRPWIIERFPVNSSWTTQVDTVNSTIPTVWGQVNSGGFTLFHPTNAQSELYVELYGVPGGKGFVANLETDDIQVGGADTTTLVGDVTVHGAIRMVYDGATKVVTCDYDLDTSDGYQWTEYASYGLAGAGGATANTDWGLASDQQFALWLYGYSAGMTISGGQLYLDNFSEGGGAPPSGGPSPVPVGSFKFKFPTNNPLLAAIASLTGHYSGIDPFGSSRQYELDVAQDEDGKVATMGTVDGIVNATGGSDLSLQGGAVTTVDNKPTLTLKSSFTGAGDGVPASLKLTSTTPLEITDIGGGTNGVSGTASYSGKVAGVPVSRSNSPVLIASTPSLENNLKKDWILDLDLSQRTVNGKPVTVGSAELLLPNGDTIRYPERTVKYSTTKGYKLTFKKGTNITAVPNRLDKKSSIKITGLTFTKVGDEWHPTGGTIAYQFLGQRGTANLLDFTGP